MALPLSKVYQFIEFIVELPKEAHQSTSITTMVGAGFYSKKLKEQCLEQKKNYGHDQNCKEKLFCHYVTQTRLRYRVSQFY